MTVTLRPATLHDVPLLQAWDLLPHVIACTTDDPTATTAFEGTDWAEEIAAASGVSYHLIAEVDGRPIGAMQIIDPQLEPTHYWGDVEPNLRALDIWIGETDALGHGYGTQMMTQVIDDAFADPAVTAGALCRPAIAIPDSLPLTEVLEQIEAADGELAIVIDEYGGFAGIITIEDIAEEIVGEIDDEHDPVTPEDVEKTDGGWLIQGDAHLDEVSRIIGYELPEGDYETIAGLVITTFEGLPAVGDSVVIPLDPDPADLATGEEVTPLEVRALVREIDKRVPSLVFVTVDAVARQEGCDE